MNFSKCIPICNHYYHNSHDIEHSHHPKNSLCFFAVYFHVSRISYKWIIQCILPLCITSFIQQNVFSHFVVTIGSSLLFITKQEKYLNWLSHLPNDTELFPIFGSYEQSCNYSCILLCVDISFHITWIKTQKCNC